jgi:hypothetical protein
VITTRRQWLQAAAALPACLTLQAARTEFWVSKDPASWSSDEKQVMLTHSPWAQEGFARMELEGRRKAPNDGTNGIPSGGMPDTRPGAASGRTQSVPMGDAPPPVPKPDSHPVQFRVLARWESALPVRMAGGPQVPELTPQYYVIRLQGLPLMPPQKAPPQKTEPGDPAPNPNEAMLQTIKEGSALERKGKPAIPCNHLFAGSGDAATDVLLFFPRPAAPITIADKLVSVESRFLLFHLSVKFPLKDMVFQGALSL